jgi:arylsulfatase A-like enzyme
MRMVMRNKFYGFHIYLKIFVLSCLLFNLVSLTEIRGQSSLNESTNDQKPNITIILADDLGFSDVGSYGSEIQTPNLDQLAKNGLRMTQFYNTARCSPTRASLLTGLYPHQAGISVLDGDWGIPEYQGYLSKHTVTLAEVLKDAGYSSYISGKWHVGNEEGHWPLDRGFERYYGLIDGASNFYNNIDYRDPEQVRSQTFLLDNEPYEIPVTTEEMWKRNEGYHMTDAFTDYALEFLNEHNSDNPFFLYLPYTAPHWPLHAFPRDIDKYQGLYEIGWDSLKTLRYEKQIELGITEPSTKLAPNSEMVVAWEDAHQQRKKEWPLEMALYAAMIDHMDQNIGRVIEKLKKMGQFENTLIIFLSDNGGCHTTPRFPYLDGEPGGPNSFPTYGYEGAEVSNVPFRMWKQFIHEGGIAGPFIAHYPKMISPGMIDRQVGHVIDFMPTILDLSGANYPDEWNGNIINPMQGISLLPVFKGERLIRNEPIYFEHQGNRGVRLGKWKLVSARFDLIWELYNVEKDPTELNDVGEEFPVVRQYLIDKYKVWADQNNVLPYHELQELMRSN